MKIILIDIKGRNEFHIDPNHPIPQLHTRVVFNGTIFTVVDIIYDYDFEEVKVKMEQL